MNADIHHPSRMLTLAGALMANSGILMACCGRLAIGGVMGAAAFCIFIAAYNFRLAESKQNNEEAANNDEEAL